MGLVLKNVAGYEIIRRRQMRIRTRGGASPPPRRIVHQPTHTQPIVQQEQSHNISESNSQSHIIISTQQVQLRIIIRLILVLLYRRIRRFIRFIRFI